MRITILGAGTVGYAIADTLSRSNHTITLVEKDPAKAERAKELDIRVITGSASESSVLFRADVSDCDLCLAVTGDDETNIVAASMAKAMGARRTLARVYSPVFRNLSTFDYQRHFNIDRLVSLEQLTAIELVRLIRRAHSHVLDLFSRGELEIQEITIAPKSPIVGKTLKEIKMPGSVRVAILRRSDTRRIMAADDSFQPGDGISLIGTSTEIGAVIKKHFHAQLPPVQRVMIMGGGETGYHIAQMLQQNGFELILYESDRGRCNYLSAHLGSHVSIIQADGLNRETLEENQVDRMDAFVACAGDDENNIIAAVEAKELGAKQVFAVVSRPDYATLVKKLGIDYVVSPRTVMAQRIRGFFNTGAVIMRTSLINQPDIEILEMEAKAGMPIVEKRIRELGLPPKCLIAGVNRDNFVQVPDAKFQIQPGDIVIVMVHNQSLDQLLEQFEEPSEEQK